VELETATPPKAKRPDLKEPSSFFRRQMGPKAQMAAAAAARAAANWQKPLTQANLIGQEQKQTHFSLNEVPQDAISRARSMESMYRRGYMWSERHETWNPKNVFPQTHLPSAPL